MEQSMAKKQKLSENSINNLEEAIDDDDQNFNKITANSGNAVEEKVCPLNINNHLKAVLPFIKNQCWWCLQLFDKMNNPPIQSSCEHPLCTKCQNERNNKNFTCKMCLSLYDDDEHEKKSNINNNEYNGVWTFDDIEDSTPDFLESPYEKIMNAINAALSDNNIFVLMPSGGGKSLIYQLPAYISGGVTLVVSPLRSLIFDQVNQLNGLQIPTAHLIGSPSENKNVISRITRNDPKYRLIYITPESLLTNENKELFIDLVTNNLMCRLVIDEAHQVAILEEDFRESYLKLKDVINTIFRNCKLSVLTAYATPDVRKEILDLLGVHNRDFKYFFQSFNRQNLRYECECINMSKKEQKVLEICDKFREETGIVYCLYKKDCDNLAEFLQKNGVSAKAYHANLCDQERKRTQTEWTQGAQSCRVIVCTIAFGRGINKPDVRFVVHIGLPKNLERYYQESGLAGRDGDYALCKLFWSTQDQYTWQQRFAKSLKDTIIKQQGNDEKQKFKMIYEQQCEAVHKMAAMTKKCRRNGGPRGKSADDKLCSSILESILKRSLV